MCLEALEIKTGLIVINEFFPHTLTNKYMKLKKTQEFI